MWYMIIINPQFSVITLNAGELRLIMPLFMVTVSSVAKVFSIFSFAWICEIIIILYITALSKVEKLWKLSCN